MKHRIPKKEKSKELGGFRVEHQTETSDPSDAPAARLQAALTFHQQGRLDEAEAVYREILVTEPDQFDAFRFLAIIAAQRKQFHEAIALFERAFEINPEHANSLNNYGIVLCEVKRYNDAVLSFDKAIALNADYGEAALNREAVLKILKRYDEVVLSCGVAFKGNNAAVCSDYGNVLQELSRYEESLLYYDRALALEPDYVAAYFNRGLALKKLKRYDEAVLSYDKAIALEPDYAEAHSNRGNALTELKRYHDAVLSYDRALALKPDYAKAHANRGVALQELKQYDEAVLSYGRALACKPDYDFLFAEQLFLSVRICDWRSFEHQVFLLREKISRHENVSTPFPVLALVDSPLLQQEAARIFINAKHVINAPLPLIAKRERHEKIRIGYYSADFQNHATTYLMAELFERHDRRRFELTAFSFGPDKQDEMRTRVACAFDRFIDVRTRSDREVALLSRELEIDIAVDLKGFTTDSRTGIFALRAAPIQVSYLGYPGTMGMDSMDYLIADQTLIPVCYRQYYTEKIVFLPDSYQVNDTKRTIAEKDFTRKECGLPEKGFVFCCFNNNYKITPFVFDSWMRILRQVEGSVFWILEDNPKAAENLRKEATRRGVDSDRLIFSKRIPLAEHLARHRLADLFLDTHPCNAHTTASDALWAGLPLLTLAGETFVARVAASLLNAIQLPELITCTQEEYEALAIELATNPDRLKLIRLKLEKNRLTTPLFDTERFTHHLEEAYGVMYERYQDGLLPEHIVSLPSAEERKELLTMALESSGERPGQKAALVCDAASDHASRFPEALMLHQQGQINEAEALYREILCANPKHFDALQLLATVAAQKRNFSEAAALFEQAFAINSDCPELLNNWGNTLKELKRYDEALHCFDRATELNPHHVEAYYNRGITLKELQRYDEALLSYDAVIALKPDYPEVYVNRGNVLKELLRCDEALLSYNSALVLKPDYTQAYFNQALALQHLKQYEAAVLSYDKAISLNPEYVAAYSNRGSALKELKRYDEALSNYGEAIARNPQFAEAYVNRGNALTDLKRYQDALLDYDRAIAVKLDYAIAYFNRGVIQQKLKLYEDAVLSYDNAYSFEPTFDFLYGLRLYARMQICDWSIFYNNVGELREKIGRCEKVSIPFPVIALLDSLVLQKEVAKLYVQEKYPANHELPVMVTYPQHERIRIGYYSADFHNHATTYLMAELFERHDRSRFELTAFSFGPDKQDEMRARVASAFDRFIDVRTRSDREVALLSRELEIDIAIDLKGFTQDSRPGIFALRAAPIQVSYLGFPGTMGAGYIDYLIADRTLIPESSQYGYTEKIVYLPDSYQINDTKRLIAKKLFTRKELGLPEIGFVFCCFNNNYKITPLIFDGWMRILRQVEGSVLWLFEDTQRAAQNLRREAIEKGVDAIRLIFAKRMPLAEHLARLRQADLFLDTFPYNAHTTASDALWAGLPLLTLSGETFAARVAASLLNAIQLPELITSTQEEYEALAIELATNPEKLTAIRQKLEKNRLTTPLFDTERFTHHLEEAYGVMYERYQEGLPPGHIVSLPSAEGSEPLLTMALALPKARSEQDVSAVAETAARSGPAYFATLQSALALHQQGCLDDAEVLYREIVHSNPDYFEAVQLLATVAAQKKNFHEALELFDHALAIKPDHPITLNNRGNTLIALKRYGDALSSYERAFLLKPDYAEACYNRALALQELERHEEALSGYEKAIGIKPDYVEALYKRGVALKRLQRYDDALLCYDKVIALKPDYAEAHYSRGLALQELQRYDEALVSYDAVIALKPDYPLVYGMRLHIRMHSGDWVNFDHSLSVLVEKIECHKYLSPPFIFFASVDSLLLQKKVSTIYMQVIFPANHELPLVERYPRHERIRIGYYSADFHNHATANLMAELFERHDRSRFELTAFSFGPEVQDEMRARVASAFDRFIEVRTLSDREVALLSRELEIDIAIDLKGVTQHSRPGIFALRAAPIQVSYLGYPGTMGAQYIDYLIADRTLIPESCRYGYTEKIVYLPDSYQVNDTKRLIAERVFTRKECGLPEIGFVFCCFNNNYKITPVTFDGWMRILKRVEGSVLWLLEDNPKAAENLRKEATERGVDAERLIFAKRMPLAEHLARHRIADLFLDTLPYNAHTTASDALWAGLPLLTLAGETFAARVAASLLNAIQLPELITSTQEEYEALAIELATNPEKLTAIRQKLEKNRLTTPLFDTERFTHHLEEAYGVMYERYQEGLPPGHIVSLPSAEGRKESLMKGTVPGVRAEQDVSVASETAVQYRSPHSTRLHSALALHQQGCLDDAEVLYREILRANPEHFDALRLLATVAAQRKNFPEAEELFDQALKINPAHATVWNNRGIALQELKRYDEALQCYDNALERKADYAAAFFYRGLVLTKLHRYDEAVLSYNRALLLKPDYAAACYNLGNTLQKLNRYDEALVCYDKVLVIKPGDAEACSNRGITLKELQRYDEAVLSYEKALALRPDYADAYYNLGNVLQDLKRYREALDNYDKVLAIRPGDAHVYSNRGIALQELKRYDEALVSYEKALALKPDYAKAYSNRGSVLQALNRNDEALLSYERAIAIKQDYAEAYRNRGVVLKELKRYDEALLSYERAIAFKPDSADGYFNLGIALRELKRYDEALINFDKTLFINPGYEFLFGVRLYTMMHICDWSTFKHHVSQLREKLERHEKASTPFPLLALIGSLLLQKQVSSDYVQEKYSANPELPLLVKRSRHDKIRIGYYSADFHNHATAYLMAELFEMHDRSRFEIIAFSFGPDRQDEMRKRVCVAFDRFFDVRTQSDREVALLSRELEIDIAVDLKGFTQDSRCGIFALRAAPIQVSYLGYPGTMGADYIDYLIADPTLIPESCRYGYTEKIAYLPDSYQVNDTKRTIAERVFTRKECGLPEKGFIFCCFNNNYKITPVTFDGWMRLLRQVEGSVLWLLEDNVTAADNLRKEAIKRGIDAARIVFAQRMPLAEHLARQRLGYLFLDTFPCNAHTTASDALWAGLPVLTLAGESFASRVAASLLNAMQLPELITSTQEEYEALAIELATNPEKLLNIRRKLEQNRLTTPLFDTRRFTQHLEQAYSMMYERSQQELPPAHLFSLPSAQGDTGTIQPLQQEYACCPLCGGKSALHCRADCSRHSLWHEPLPRILEWMRCTSCYHVYTRHFWTQAGIDELFRNAHQNQLAGFGASQDAKRANWVPVVDRVLHLLGGYRSSMDKGSHPTWVDVGCGDGALAMTASDYGFSALGLDARSEAVRRIVELGFKAQESDFMQCTFEHKLDVLSMMDVLEHMPYPGFALEKAAELIRAGGVLVISLPDLSCSSWRMMDAAKSNPYWMEIEHHHNFSRERLIALLGERGFEVADFGIPHRYKAQMELYAVRKIFVV